MIGWMFCALTYIAAGGIIASLQAEHDWGRGEYVFWMLCWPLHYVIALVMRVRGES